MNPNPFYEPDSIRALFDEMAATYGFINLVTSFGFSARWRRQCLAGLKLSGVHDVADLMCGMGELWRSIRQINTTRSVIAVDISREMTRRAKSDWPFDLNVHIADVLQWQYAPASADLVVSSFGLKTFDPRQQEKLAECVAGLLRPGGVFSFVEISVPKSWLLRAPYMFYLKRGIPILGRIFLGNPENYRMLGVYTEAFGDCDHFAACLRNCGLQVSPISLFFGCATGVRGIKPHVQR